MNMLISPKEVKRCTDPKLLAEYATTIKIDVKIEVAKNPYTTASTLNSLAYESNEEILLAVASHHNAGKYGLRYLGVKLGDEKIALQVAKNYKTTTDTLDAMYEVWKNSPKIVKAIKTHPNVSSYTAELCTFCEMR